MMMGLDLLIGAAVVAYVLGWRPHHHWWQPGPSDRRTSSSASQATAESPLDILKVRYARGEISTDEYYTLREHLSS